MFELAFCLDSCSKNIIDSYECNGTATCDGSIDWNARYVHGDHTLVVRARQESYLSATDSIHATVTESAKLFAQGPWSGVRGKTTRIKGSLMDGNHPLPNAPLIATIDPAIGRTTQKSLSTNRKGYFTFASKLKTNSVVTFRTKDGSNIKADPFSAKVSIAAVAACSLAQNPIGAGHHDALTCRLPNLPAGVSVRLLGISEHPIHGTSKAGFAIIGFRVPSGVSGDAGVSMIIDANKVYAESGGGATLHIR
jgi:hypothetical protein